MTEAAGQASSLVNVITPLYQFITNHPIAAFVGAAAWDVTKHFIRYGVFKGIVLAFDRLKTFVHLMRLIGRELTSDPDPELLHRFRRRDIRG